MSRVVLGSETTDNPAPPERFAEASGRGYKHTKKKLFCDIQHEYSSTTNYPQRR